MKKYLYNSVGSISLGLGVLGVFLPLLPSTCFVLLATWAFAKSSPAFHAWLYHKSPFSESIQNWQVRRIIPTKVKWIAFSSIIISYVISALFVSNIYILAGLTIGMLVLITYLFSKPSEPRKSLKQAVIFSQIP